MICPRCGHDHDPDWPPFGFCVECDEDMRSMIHEADADDAADNRRRDKELREDE